LEETNKCLLDFSKVSKIQALEKDIITATNEIFDSIDKNNDGFITKEEFILVNNN
jgi:Ca2+-binding EF-hand superfamily protein